MRRRSSAARPPVAGGMFGASGRGGEIGGHTRDRLRSEPVVHPLLEALGLDDARRAEDLEVVADEGLGDVELLDEVADAQLLGGELLDDPPARWLAERLEDLGATVRVRINGHAYAPLL